MRSLAFREYILKRPRRYTPLSAFLANLASDEEFSSINTWTELQAFVKRRALGANAEMFARDLWDAYIRAARREEKRRHENTI